MLREEGEKRRGESKEKLSGKKKGNESCPLRFDSRPKSASGKRVLGMCSNSNRRQQNSLATQVGIDRYTHILHENGRIHISSKHSRFLTEPKHVTSNGKPVLVTLPTDGTHVLSKGTKILRT